MRLFLLLILWTQTKAWFWSSDQVQTAPGLSCKDENNNDVDWYILYKSPRGQDCIYISTNVERKSEKPIGHSQGVLANTLRPMFEENMPDSFGFLSYSDQPPNKKPGSTYGHSKGVVLGDSEMALWLTHSTPNFPFRRNLKDFWPKSGNRNGQTFMCVTLKLNQLHVIGTHLQHIHAFTFDKRIPSSFPQEIKDASDNRGHAPEETVVEELKVGDRGHLEIKMVAKKEGNTAAEGDLYAQMSNIFKSDVKAKTWGCQTNNDKSYCDGQYKVLNVESVQTRLGEWNCTQDHSKWAITTNNNNPWTCIADMNRAESQYKRPGGALCINNERVTNIFKGFVRDPLPCRKRPRSCDQDVEGLTDNFTEMNLTNHEEF